MPGGGIDDVALTELIAFAEGLADAAAEATLRYFRRLESVEDKAGGRGYDPVTAADREAEAIIRQRIKAAYPDHGILGEEHGRETGSSACTWVIDPIDGTRSFIAGIPLWGTLIALNDGARPILGIMDQPYLGERFVGSRAGARMTERGGDRVELATRPCGSLSVAVLMCTDPAMFLHADERAAFDSLRAAARLTRYGADCYAYCMLARGLVDLVVEADLKPYDIQALIPVIEGAGGLVTDWRGGPADQGGQVIAAGDPAVHAAALAIRATAAAR
jgi:myo-inositol-1(or 4)-monophosphatase